MVSCPSLLNGGSLRFGDEMFLGFSRSATRKDRLAAFRAATLPSRNRGEDVTAVGAAGVYGCHATTLAGQRGLSTTTALVTGYHYSAASTGRC